MSNAKIEGIPRPNSVVVYDNEYGFQFRIQCEVPLSNQEPNQQQAMELLRHLMANTKAGYTRAKTIVADAIVQYNKTVPPDKQISDLSQKIIGMGLDDAISKAAT